MFVPRRYACKMSWEEGYTNDGKHGKMNGAACTRPLYVQDDFDRKKVSDLNFTKLLFAIGAVICLPLYGFLCITALDPQTGFFASGMLSTIFYAALFVVPVLMILFSRLQKRHLVFSISNSRVLSVLSFALGGVMIAGGVADAVTVAAALMGLSQDGTSMVVSVLVLSALQIVMALISGGVFLRLGVSYMRENISNRGSMTFIFPVVWALITCVEMFRDYPQIAGMPERTLYLLCLLAFTLFLMGQSRILSDVDVKKGVYWTNAFGFCTALFGLTMTVGEIVSYSMMTLPLFDAILTFVMALYCLSFSFNTAARR